jgi:hypothetical protein
MAPFHPSVRGRAAESDPKGRAAGGKTQSRRRCRKRCDPPHPSPAPFSHPRGNGTCPVMAGLVPAIPMLSSAAPVRPGSPGQAGDDAAGEIRRDVVFSLCSGHGVSSGLYPLLSRPDGGRAREASQMWGGERSCRRPRTSAGGRPLAALCWSKSQRLKVPRATRHPGSSINSDHRAGLHLAPPSSNPTAQGSQALGHKVLAL